MALTAEQRKEVINNLVTNGCGCWEESDKEVLNSFNDEKLEALESARKESSSLELIANAAQTGFEDALGNSHKFNPELNRWETVLNAKDAGDDDSEDEEDDEMEDAPKSKKKGPTMNKAGQGMADQPVSVEQYIASAPPQLQAVFNSLLDSDKRAKADLIEKMVANAGSDEAKNTLKATLQKLATDELRSLQATQIVGNRQQVQSLTDYSGASAAGGLTTNSSEDLGTPLPMPQAM